MSSLLRTSLFWFLLVTYFFLNYSLQQICAHAQILIHDDNGKNRLVLMQFCTLAPNILEVTQMFCLVLFRVRHLHPVANLSLKYFQRFKALLERLHHPLIVG
mmetsp:Transcript_69250/g.102996  ORF Transcript_69250/g.102996 Transcript_69250/m.102996 type:complete len:102 (-) Transcript_69250:1425-1730(-)